MSELHALSLADNPSRDEFASQVLDWVYEAGNPYFNWFFGEADTSLETLKKWQQRSSSEVFLGRTIVLRLESKSIGGFIAMNGKDLSTCRKSDTLAVVKDFPAELRKEIMQRMGQIRGYFTAPEPDEFYLSKMGVVAEARGSGLGHQVVSAYLEHGRALGFNKFRLDVSANNLPAVHLYESVGFQVTNESTMETTGMKYLSMYFEQGAL